MQAAKYNYIVENDRLSDCVRNVMDIMDKCKSDRNKIEKLLMQK